MEPSLHSLSLQARCFHDFLVLYTCQPDVFQTVSLNDSFDYMGTTESLSFSQNKPWFLLMAKKKYNENFWKKFWLLTLCLCLWRLNYTGRRWGGFWKDPGDGNYTDWQKSVPWAWTLSWPNDTTAIITSSPRDPNESRLFSDTGTSQRLCAKSSLNGNLPTFKRTLVAPWEWLITGNLDLMDHKAATYLCLDLMSLLNIIWMISAVSLFPWQRPRKINQHNLNNFNHFPATRMCFE